MHVLEHISFKGAGALYWWHLLSPIRSRRLGGMGPVVYMAATKVLVGIPGIGPAFAPDALYAFYEEQPRYWGLERGDRLRGGRPDHGHRAVDHHGHRASWRSSSARWQRASGRSSGASATAKPEAQPLRRHRAPK